MKLWLDDVLPPLKGWVWCKSAEECTLMWAIFKNEVTEVSLDHDLGDGKKTGYDVTKWLEMEMYDEPWPMPIVHIHSSNGPGRKNMNAAISSAARYSVINGQGHPIKT